MSIPWEYEMVERPFCQQLQAMGWEWIEGDPDLPETTDRTSVVAQWDDTEVARRWLILCPLRKDAHGLPEEPTDFELNSASFRTSGDQRRSIVRISSRLWPLVSRAGEATPARSMPAARAGASGGTRPSLRRASC